MEPPECLALNTMPLKHPFAAQRVSALTRALVGRQKSWLKMLSEEIRAALRKFPSAQLKENGQAFFDTCLSDGALCYGDGEWSEIQQEPGSFYIGNMCGRAPDGNVGNMWGTSTCRRI